MRNTDKIASLESRLWYAEEGYRAGHVSRETVEAIRRRLEEVRGQCGVSDTVMRLMR